MIADVLQIDPQELAAVVPDCYADFRPIVADGLRFFLQHLAPPRLAEVLQAQAELPVDAGLARRLVVFLHACPALHKIGQVVARNRHLNLELRRHLQQLESLEPQTPDELLRPILERELSAAPEKYHIHVSERHLAEGSVAVVIPLTWTDPADGPGAPSRPGVAKVLKPGIVDRLGEDLEILDRLAGYLEERWAAYRLPPLAYREILAEVADLLTHEVQLPLEQIHLRQAAVQFGGCADVVVPRPLPFSTPALTAMERLDGWKVTEPPALGAWQRPHLFRSIVRSLLSSVLLNRDESVLFHGDPHAGNLLISRDGRLGILDWSLAGQLTTDDRVRLSQILAAAWTLDAPRIAAAAAGLASAGAPEELICRHVEAALAELRWYRLPGPTWTIGLLDALTRAGVRFPPRLLLFRKAFLTLQGVLSDVCPACSLEAVLTAEALVQLASEWPLRWWKPLGDRSYGTHLSSVDLVQLALRSPAALVQLWQRLAPSPGIG